MIENRDCCIGLGGMEKNKTGLGEYEIVGIGGSFI